MATKVSWLRPQYREEGRQTIRQDAEKSAEQGCLLLQQVGVQPVQIHQQRRDEEARTLLCLKQQNRLKARQQHMIDGVSNWRSSSSSSRISQHQHAVTQRPHALVLVHEKRQYRGYRQHDTKQETLQQSPEEEHEEEERAEEDGEEFPEREEQEDDRQVAVSGTAAHRGVQRIAQEEVGECYGLRELTMVWPLQLQHELLPVELTGGCCFQEEAVHGQDGKLAADSHSFHFEQKRKQGALPGAEQSLPNIENVPSGRRTTTPVEGEPETSTEGQQEKERYLIPEAEEEGDDEPGRASFSMVLRPNAFASLRSRSVSSIGAGSFSLRKLVSGESFRRDYSAKRERRERVAGKEASWEAAAAAAKPARVPSAAGGEADETVLRGDVEGALSRDAVVAVGSAATDRTSFIATATDTGSLQRRSVVSACCYWNKRILCSRTRWHYLIFLSIYAYLIGPIYLNWAPLRELFFRSGAYAWECDPHERDPSSLRYITLNEEGDNRNDSNGKTKDGGGGGRSPAACTLQRLRVGNLYTVCAAADFGFSFLGGLVVDWLGPKTGSLLGSTSMFVGWLLLALSSENVPVYIPGMILFGIGIDMAFYGTLSVSRLFPGHANTVIAAIVGMRGLGLMSPLILNAIRLPFTAVMLGYALGGLLPAVLIASVYAPWKPFQEDSLRKKKRRRKRREEPLLTADALNSSSGEALHTAAPVSHDSTGSRKVAAQETAADLFSTEEAPDTERHRGRQQEPLLFHGEVEEQFDQDDLWQQQKQKEQQLLDLKQKEGRQRPSVAGSALSYEVAGDKKQQMQGFRGLVTEDKRRLWQEPAAASEAKDEHEYHFNVYGEQVEEGWLSETGNSEKESERLFSRAPQLQQEHHCSLDKHEGGEKTANPRESWLQEPARSEKISSVHSEPDSHFIASHSSPCVRRPREFPSDVNSSVARAQVPPDTAAAAAAASSVVSMAGVRIVGGGVSATGAASRMTGRSESSYVQLQEQMEMEVRNSGRRASLQLRQQETHSMEFTDTPRTQQEARQVAQQSEDACTLWRTQGSHEDEEQQRQPGISPEDSVRSSSERIPQLLMARRTRSTAADEESTGMWGISHGGMRETQRNSPAAENRQQQEFNLENSKVADVASSSCRDENCGAAATASCAAASSETPGNSPAPPAGETVELCGTANPKAGGRATVGAKDHDDMHASTLPEKHLSLRRPLSSRQYSRSFRGRMQYVVAYVQQHPWSVSSVAFIRDYLFTLVYLPVVPYFTFSLMRSVYFSDASEDLVPSAIDTLHVLLACVCVVPPLTGLLADMWTIMPCLVLINTTGTFVILGSLIAYLTHIVVFEYFAVVFYMLFAAVLTNQVYFYVADTFPQKHLGKLCGFACSIGGVTSLSVTSMFEFSVKTKGGFTIMLSIMLGLSVLCYGFIAILYLGQKRLKRKEAEAAAAAAAAAVAAADASQNPVSRANTNKLAAAPTAAAAGTPPGPSEQERTASGLFKE